MSSPVNNHGQKRVLRLRPRPRQRTNVVRIAEGSLDGPWNQESSILRAPDDNPNLVTEGSTMGEYRATWNKRRDKDLQEIHALKAEKGLPDMTILDVIIKHNSVNMMQIEGWTDEKIESALEKYYVGAQYYLRPGYPASPSTIERFGPDWGLNARGIYYRHHCSKRWVTPGNDLWLPSLEGIDWDHCIESSRLTRAKTFLRHVLDNEKWKKSEYAWEADAWADVFHQMRNDPVLAVDKHEYNTIRLKRDPVTCLLAGEPKFIKRIPDATFGLATFKPADYQSATAEWDLDHDRLEALLLHRHCGLIADPRWGGADLVWPFAVYEAKGWSGDAQEARRQGCSAGAVYLDMLDRLAQQPGKVGQKNRLYQSGKSRPNQVFVFTSFGAHWHILVGYKRARLTNEYAGQEGFSESVYVFQRVWSGRVGTLRRAWELLSLIDQIHLWSVTDFRASILQCLRQWHEFGRLCYAHDVNFLVKELKKDRFMHEGKELLLYPEVAINLAEWAQNLTEDARAKLQERVMFHFREAYRRDYSVIRWDWPASMSCLLDDCGPQGNPGYPLFSKADMATHYREIHGRDDAQVALMEQMWDEAESDTDEVPLPIPQRKRPGIAEPGPSAKRYKLIPADEFNFEPVVTLKKLGRKKRNQWDGKEIKIHPDRTD